MAPGVFIRIMISALAEDSILRFNGSSGFPGDKTSPVFIAPAACNKYRICRSAVKDKRTAYININRLINKYYCTFVYRQRSGGSDIQIPGDPYKAIGLNFSC